MRCRLKMRFIISFELLCVIYELLLSSSISAERNFDINIGKYMYTEWYDPGGGGGTLIFSYIRRLGSFFWFKILNFNIFLNFQKNKYFLGYEDFVDIFVGVFTKLDYI